MELMNYYVTYVTYITKNREKTTLICHMIVQIIYLKIVKGDISQPLSNFFIQVARSLNYLEI